MGPLSVEAGLRLTYSIGVIASLSFLGLGMQPPTADWGLMINENRIALSVQPWGVILPVIAIAILTIGTNLLADAIARATASTESGEIMSIGTTAAAETVEDLSTVLRMNDLRVSAVGGNEILLGISLELYRGQILGLVGESGSGKNHCGACLHGALPHRTRAHRWGDRTVPA